MNESSTVIQVSGLHKRFGKLEVLKGLDLEVPAGSIFGFLGLNGAGKTTLIRILLGLLKADAPLCQGIEIRSLDDCVDIPQRIPAMLIGHQEENIGTFFGFCHEMALLSLGRPEEPDRAGGCS